MPAKLIQTSVELEELVKLAASIPVSTPPREFARDIILRSISLGLNESELFRFLKKQTAKRSGLPSLLANRSAFRSLVASCRRRARSSSPAGAAGNSVKTARLVLGRILSPVETDADGAPVLKPAMQVRARVTLAVLCIEQLASINGEKGWDTVMVSYPKLALRMGVSWPTAKAALNDLLDLGWIKEISAGRRADSARRFQIAGHLNKDQAAFVKRVKGEDDRVMEPGLYDAIGALAEQPGERGQNDLLIAALVQSVTRPAWAYGTAPLGAKTWLLTLALAADVDPAQLGLQKRSIPALKRTMTEVGLALLIGSGQGDTTSAESDLPERLFETLKEWGQNTGAYEAAGAARAAYKDNAATRRDELTRTRQMRLDAGPAVDRLFGPVTTITPADAPEEQRNRWVAGASREITKTPMTERRRKALAYELERRLKKCGYEDAKTLAGGIMANARPFLGSDAGIPPSSTDQSVKTAWLKSSIAEMQDMTMRAEDHDDLKVELDQRLKRRGYDGGTSERLAALILEEVTLAA